MQSINFFVYIFFFCIVLQHVASDNAKPFNYKNSTNRNDNISVAQKNTSYGQVLKKFGKDLTEGVNDSKKRVKDLYDDTSAKIDQLKSNVKASLSQEIDYIQKDIVPTCLGIPYYYYGGFLLLSYASSHSLTYNLQMIGGVVITLGFFGNFIKWSVYKYNKMYFEKQSKK